MSSSPTGPARLLLDSFTVAATPQTLSVLNAEDEDRANGTGRRDGQYAGSPILSRMTTPALAVAAEASAEVEEEPCPSDVAPQPAPAPASSSQPASSTRAVSTERLSAPLVDTSSHSRLHSFFSPRSRKPMWRVPLESQTGRVGNSGDDLSGISAAPFSWRSSLPRAARSLLPTPASNGGGHVATSVSASHPAKRSSDVSDRLGRTSLGAFTPRIRYRTSSSTSPEARATSCWSSTPTPNASVKRDGEGKHRRLSPVRSASAEWAPQASSSFSRAAAPLLGLSVPARSSFLRCHGNTEGAAFMSPPPSVLATARQGGGGVSTTSSAGGTATRSARVVTLCVPAETAMQQDDDATRRTQGWARASVSSNKSTTMAATSPVSGAWMQQERGKQALRRGHDEVAEETEASADVTRSRSHALVHHAEVGEGVEVDAATEPIAAGHLTQRSLTEEYSRFSTEGAVGWVGLQLHLRRHTQSSQIITLDLTCCHMRRDQWTWFTQDILPELHALEVLRLVQMRLEDEEVAELARGSCGMSAAGDGRRAAGRRWRQSPSPASRHGGGGSGAGSGSRGPAVDSAALPHLRVLDLSGNAVTQRSCTHLGKMMLWMAGTLEEVRLLGNPLKDYGMQTLSVYVAKLNLETLEQDPSLFPAALRERCTQLSQKCRRGHAKRRGLAGPALSSPRSAAAAGVVRAGFNKGEGKEDPRHLVAELPLGPVLLDLRDCRASPRGLAEMLAAASRAYRLRTLVLSHNVAGVTSLLPLPASAYRKAEALFEGETMEYEERGARVRDGDSGSTLSCAPPLPLRLRLAKTPLIYSGALMRHQPAAFSDAAVFATSCALSTLVFHGVPLSQTCSPLGFRELLLNIFFSCPRLDLVDLSDTFERSLVPPEAQQALSAEANSWDVATQPTHGPEALRRLYMYREDQNESEFVLASATVSGQTRLGDIFGELMAHAAFHAMVRRRLAPAAFLHLRELHLSNTGLTDAGVLGLCVSVRRGRTQTGMLASLAVLNLSDNLLTVRGCVRVISTFLLRDDTEIDGEATRSNSASPTTASAADGPVLISHLTALALQRNMGFESARSHITLGRVSCGIGDAADAAVHLRQVCEAAETAVLRRAELQSAARINQVRGSGISGSAAKMTAVAREERVPSLIVYFSAPPMSSATWPASNSGGNGQCRPTAALSPTARADVFYAGCDEEGDVYCTCPCGRFYEPKHLSTQRVQRKDTVREGLTDASQQRQKWSSRAVSRPLAGAATARREEAATSVALSGTARSGSGALGAAEKQRSFAQDAPQCRLFAALDVPHSAATTALGLAAARGRAGSESPNGLVNATPLHHLCNPASGVAAASTASVSSSSLSFAPSPSSASMSAVGAARRTSDVAAARADTCFGLPPSPPQQQQGALPSRRETRLSASGGVPFGALFMKRTEEAPPLTLGTSNGTDLADAASVVPVDADGDISDTLTSVTAASKRSGSRPARLRRTRTFTLSFDHPAGHLLCRALSVLLRPAPDALGEGARAALDEDLLAALKRILAASTARSASEQGGGDDCSDADKAGNVPTVVVEAVRYLPPQLPSPIVVDGGHPSQPEAESQWMRFEVTTNERRRAMAQLLQAVLNVPLPDQRVCFERLLRFLTQHVQCGVERDGESIAEDPWDPVRAIERAARSSAAVRARLEIAYGGDAVAAVHTRHPYHGATDTTLIPCDDASCGAVAASAGAIDCTDGAELIVRLDHLYLSLWQELGLPVGNTAGSPPPHALASASIVKEGAEGLVNSGRRPRSLDRAAGGSESHMSLLTPNGAASHRSSEAAVSQSPPPSAAARQQRRHVASVYDGVGGASNPRQQQGIPASLRRAQRPDPFAPAAASGGSEGSVKSVARSRRGAAREEGDGDTSADSTSVHTPEKQLSCVGHIESAGAATALSPSPLPVALDDSNSKAPQPNMLPVDVVLTDQLIGPPSPAKTLHASGDAAASPLFPQKAVTCASLLTTAEDERGHRRANGGGVESEVLCAVTSRLRVGSSGDAGSSLGSDCIPSLQPLQEQSRRRQHARPAPVHVDATSVQAEEAEGEEDIVIVSPIRVQRTSSQLIGRVKTFTLSYTHQEGTAVCRAWRLLHTATQVCQSGSGNTNSDPSDALAEVAMPMSPVSPSAPSSLAGLAKMAQECLCADFLAFLQPPDEDTEHAVLSVSVHCDSGVATAMLQVQVQTNERRAVLADRLQHSNHGVRRGTGRHSRSGLVPLTVQEVDRFYFPRLTRLLRQYKTVADTVAQVQAFLRPRAAVQARLLQSYGSVGALVHYYHGSAAALEHELGVSSWQALMEPRPPSDAIAGKLTEGFISPTMVVGQEPRRRNAVVEEGDEGSDALPEGSLARGSTDAGEGAPRFLSHQGANTTPGSPPQSATAAERQRSRSLSGSESAPGATKLQGRPPPHPRRPPTPPHAITHTSSVSFDEVTDEPTSEAGPVVVLRGTTPTPTPRSPSSTQSLNPQYFPVMYRQALSSTPPSPDGRRERGSDTGVVSPLTAASSAAGSPKTPQMDFLLECSAQTGTGTAPENALSHMPMRRVSRQPADGRDAASAAKEGASVSQPSCSGPSDTPGTAAATVSSSSPLGVATPKTTSFPGNAAGGSTAPHPRLPAERDHSNADGNSNTSSRPPHPRPGCPGATAGASGSHSVAGSDRCNSEYERVLEGKYKRLMRVAYDGVARGSVPLDPQHQQKTVIGRGSWGGQKVELSLEWEILFVLTFEKSRKLGRSSRRAQMLVHPVGCGFECAAGDDPKRTASTGTNGGDASSLLSSTINGEAGEGGHHPPATLVPKLTRKKELSKSAASHLLITIQRPFTPDEVGSSSHAMEETLMAGALLTVSSSSKTGRLLGGGSDDASTTSRVSAGVNQAAQEYVFQLCQSSLTLDIEMKSSKRVQEALRLLKNSIRRATQAVKKSMLNAHIPPPVQMRSSAPAAHGGPLC
ncbi:hypothetical protein GH5_05211 [Leishmania sp. Ghana 2012 LV757]|uniref:hypothetical protein n=1 Tax=Leishmania sp. Ghana 2012 LV757 TaxID=2803181 RepID=UPI001B5A6698|nr:hypothetical protein GH5_05211 [Leishmania sp. Ghana 2012 LV757]